MIISYDGLTPITVANPLFGYEVTIRTAMHIKQRADGSYSIYDPGLAYDTYFCKCTMLLSKDNYQHENFISFLTALDSRGQELTIDLSDKPGFFPFGPYRGDTGSFNVKLVYPIEQQTVVGHPEDYWETKLTFVYTGTVWPTYSPPSAVAEGDLTIGSAMGLRWPDSQPDLTSDYLLETQVTHGNNAYIIDRTQSGDCFRTDIQLILNQSNASAIQSYLIGTGRGGTIVITPPSNTYVFGVENNDTGNYDVNWIDGEMVMTHETFNRWTTKVSFHTVV